MSGDGFDNISRSTGLPIGVSAELRRFFELSQHPEFVRQHNERLRRIWEQSNPDHPQVVYSLFDVVVDGELVSGMAPLHKPFGTPAIHHAFWFQAEKELEYWAMKYIGRKVSASFYVRSYAGAERWVLVERKTISLEPPAPAPKAVAKAAANDGSPLKS